LEFYEVDITLEAKKILSCIAQTGQRYGRKLICDILRGRGTRRVFQRGMDSQSTYGELEEMRLSMLREIMEFLEVEEYIEARGTEYPTLALGKKARAVLFEDEKVMMKRSRPKTVALKKTKRVKQAVGTDPSLFAELKALRRKLADETGVPAYVVFSDATLVDMCRVRPKSLEEMMLVSGVGHVKLEKYGKKFLQVLTSHP
jgi:ATP-dependent DNA helicase RecQ